MTLDIFSIHPLCSVVGVALRGKADKRKITISRNVDVSYLPIFAKLFSELFFCCNNLILRAIDIVNLHTVEVMHFGKRPPL